MYEIWKKSELGTSRGSAERTHYTLDASMQSAIELSRGSSKQEVYNYDPKDPWGNNKITIDIPNAFAVVDRGAKQSTIRGFGIGGKWYDSKDCKRCKSTGQDPNN